MLTALQRLGAPQHPPPPPAQQAASAVPLLAAAPAGESPSAAVAHQQDDVMTVMVRHVLMAIVREIGNEDVVRKVVDTVFVPMGRQMFPVFVMLSIMAAVMLVTTIITLIMMVSFFIRPPRVVAAHVV